MNIKPQALSSKQSFAKHQGFVDGLRIGQTLLQQSWRPRPTKPPMVSGTPFYGVLDLIG